MPQVVVFCKAIDKRAVQCGVSAQWESAGGGSDANFVGAKGVPVVMVWDL